MEKIETAVRLMRKLDRLHRMEIDERVEAFGLHRSRHFLLMQLAREGKCPSQIELARRMDITPAAVTGALKKLELDGYIKRALGNDNRFNEVYITEKGREMVARSREAFHQVDAAFFDGFTEEEIDMYISFLRKIESNIRPADEA